MKKDRYMEAEKVLFFLSLLLLSVVLDFNHYNWQLGPIIGISAGFTYWCLYPGYENSLTLIKSLLLLSAAILGIPWTAVTLFLGIEEILRRKIRMREA